MIFAIKPHNFLYRFFKDKGGASAIVFAVTLPILVGFLGLGTEVGFWYMKDREIQTAADIAAYTAALELRSGSDDQMVESEASSEAARNGFDTSTAAMTLTFLSSTLVEVVIVDTQPRLFSALFSDDENIEITATARAEFQSGGPACVLALSTIEFDALTFTGNTSVNLTDCNIMSNSGATRSILQTGHSDVTADCVYAVGGIDFNDNMSTTECDNPVEGAAELDDPYIDLTVPVSPANCTTIPSFTPHSTVVLAAGRYCGDMALKGDVTFSGGEYIFEGDFTANSQADITGTNTTIIMTGGGELQFNGGAEINLSAPTSGDYSGVLFYQDRASSGLSNTINGNSSSSFQGAMYFPTSEVRMLGSGSVAGGCTQLIAYTIYFSGTSDFEHECDSAGTTQVNIAGAVDLVL